MDHALTWAFENGDKLGPVGILLLVGAVFIVGLDRGWIVLRPRYHDLQTLLKNTQIELKAERAGHDTGRDALAETKTALAVANARISELECDLSECRGELKWQTSGRQPRRHRVEP